MRVCPAGFAGKGACARCLSGFPTSGLGRRPERNIGAAMRSGRRHPNKAAKALTHRRFTPSLALLSLLFLSGQTVPKEEDLLRRQKESTQAWSDCLERALEPLAFGSESEEAAVERASADCRPQQNSLAAALKALIEWRLVQNGENAQVTTEVGADRAQRALDTAKRNLVEIIRNRRALPKVLSADPLGDAQLCRQAALLEGCRAAGGASAAVRL